MTLRRRSYDDESAMEAGVDHLLREFTALTEEPAAVETVAPAVTGGGEPAYLVAAYNAPDETKAVAHFQCDGVADEVEIHAAISALGQYVFGDDENPAESAHGGRGTVVLSTGEFTFSNPGTMTLSPGVTLVGSGRSTVLLADDAATPDSVPVFVLLDRASIGNFYVDEGGETPG